MDKPCIPVIAVPTTAGTGSEARAHMCVRVCIHWHACASAGATALGSHAQLWAWACGAQVTHTRSSRRPGLLGPRSAAVAVAVVLFAAQVTKATIITDSETNEKMLCMGLAFQPLAAGALQRRRVAAPARCSAGALQPRCKVLQRVVRCC